MKRMMTVLFALATLLCISVALAASPDPTAITGFVGVWKGRQAVSPQDGGENMRELRLSVAENGTLEFYAGTFYVAGGKTRVPGQTAKCEGEFKNVDGRPGIIFRPWKNDNQEYRVIALPSGDLEVQAFEIRQVNFKNCILKRQ